VPALAAAAVPFIAFMHNHANGSESLARRIGPERTIIAFPSHLSATPRRKWMYRLKAEGAE